MLCTFTPVSSVAFNSQVSAGLQPENGKSNNTGPQQYNCITASGAIFVGNLGAGRAGKPKTAANKN